MATTNPPAGGGDNKEKALTVADKAIAIQDFLNTNKAKIVQALPKFITYERMLTTVLNSIRRNPGLAECTAVSVYSCVMQSAQLGLPPDDIRGLAYLIPFKNKRGVTECQLMPGYKGFIKLAKDTEKVVDVYANVVYEKEPFEIEEGLSRRLVHKPLPPDQRGEKVIGAYTVIVMKDGTKTFAFMWEKEIQDRRRRSKAANSGPWMTDENEMRKKTTVRQAMKYQDLGSDLISKAVSLDEAIDTPDMNTREAFEENEFLTDVMPGKPHVHQPEEQPEDAEVVEHPEAATPAAEYTEADPFGGSTAGADAPTETPEQIKAREEAEAKAKAAQDADFVKQIRQMLDEMKEPAGSAIRNKANEIMASSGLSAVLDYVAEEYHKWLEKKPKSVAGTSAPGQAGHSSKGK